MGRTSAAPLVATLGIGAGGIRAAELDTVNTFGIDAVAITPPAPAAQDRFLGATPGPGGGTYAVVGLCGSVRAGRRRYTLSATLPAGPRTRTKITHQIVLR